MRLSYHTYDIPKNIEIKGSIAIDTEAMGLNYTRDRLCVVQLCDANGNVHIVHFPDPKYDSPVLKSLLEDESRLKIFHFARFDVGIIYKYLNTETKNIYCTKIASRLSRTYTDSHSLRELCQVLLGVRISKQQQTSDWGSDILTSEQIDYAANDVLHLHNIKGELDKLLKREGRSIIAKKCFEAVVTRAILDVMGWDSVDIFAH
ncbi:Ribonuclease D [Candidatus Cyrtobacter comes]|uniref:Ribonuclease D n=1 Tax=Candidatus Cyrtobacter comes TaxID=675776 RepID=A0ABU5L8Y3_9RICK|nr:ribonuclease H-like domain-containing protein [Candidatus Cyrtobacter comes]MDZ5762588.1 Ribonuclease D [Candidatus Cyrtobacter comes]